ncbi:MAG: hypothetical protein WB818_03000 [Desulfobacterales bacterium]|jgi:hypothetical protein
METGCDRVIKHVQGHYTASTTSAIERVFGSKGSAVSLEVKRSFLYDAKLFSFKRNTVFHFSLQPAAHIIKTRAVGVYNH